MLLITNLSILGLTAQKSDTLRVDCTANLVLSIPLEYGDTLYGYEEGFFRIFFWGNEDVLSIQCGSMSDPMSLRDTIRYEIIQKCETRQKEILTGIEKETGKCWGIVRFKRYRIVVSYICSPERRNLFEEVLESVKLE